jgi:DNA-binding NarL/FixJ family response regulator
MRILLVDCHGVYRKGLGLTLQIHFPGSQILEAERLQEARKEFDPDGALDLVLVDADDPDVSFDVLHSVRRSHPRTRLAALSATTNRAAILGILESGLFGFISKSQSDEEIFSAIHDILSGRIYVPFNISQLDETHGSIPAARNRGMDTPSPDAERLTPRQRQILPLLAKGIEISDRK